MEDLKKYLREGESLLWTGRPCDFETMDNQYKGSITKRVLITAAATILLLILFVACCNKNNIKPSWGVITLLAAFGAYICYIPFGDAANLAKKYVYGITDQRLLIYTGSCKSIHYKKIRKAAFIEDASGKISLLVNDAVDEVKNGNVRSLAVCCVNKDVTDFEKCMALYAISDEPAVRAILKEYIPLS